MSDAPFPSEMLNDIRRFFKSEHTRPLGKSLYEDVFNTGYFFPLQRQEELRRMMDIARTIQPRIVMEIGTDKGGGLLHWCKCLPSVQKVIACEIRGTPYSTLFEKNFPHIEFLWIEKSSRDPWILNSVRRWLRSDKIDCLFIDGCKNSFKEDFDAYLPRMNPNGIVFMHDITDDLPRAAYDEVCSRGYRHKEVIDLSDSYRAVEKEKQGIPPASSHEGWLRHWKGASAGVGVIYLEKVNQEVKLA